MFETFYGSFWQHPLLLWVFPAIFAVLIRPRGGFFGNSLLVFLVLTVVDPLMTGPVSDALGWEGGVANGVMIFFVLLGDYRLFFFIEHYGAADREVRPGAARPYLSALAFALIVPLSQAALIKALPGAFENVRYTFLAYELLFLALAAVFRFVVLPRRNLPQDVYEWLSSLCSFSMAYYALWSAADVIILMGADFGFAVRVVPNVLYYGLFLPFVYCKAPANLKGPKWKGAS